MTDDDSNSQSPSFPGTLIDSLTQTSRGEEEARREETRRRVVVDLECEKERAQVLRVENTIGVAEANTAMVGMFEDKKDAEE